MRGGDDLYFSVCDLGCDPSKSSGGLWRLGDWAMSGIDPFGLGVVGEAGIEYAFSGIPIVIGADWRPNLRLVEDTDFLVDQFGLNVRWRFGKSRSNTPTTQAPS